VATDVSASAFNIAYNRAEIIAHWPAAGGAFEQIIPAVNGTFFAVGMSCFLWAAWPVAAALRRVRSGNPPPGDILAGVRRRCLRTGGTIALICVACWALAGVVWPVALRASAGPPPQG